MGDYFVGEIRLLPYNRVPNGWLACEGQVLAIAQNQVLFSLLGITYGGDGKTTFALPDLRGRVPAGFGSLTNPNLIGSPATYLNQGTVGGSEQVTLNLTQIPMHTHALCADPANATSPAIINSYPSTPVRIINTAPPAPNIYAVPGSLQPLNVASLDTYGSGGGHENRQPFLPLRYCICSVGVYPPRN